MQGPGWFHPLWAVFDAAQNVMQGAGGSQRGEGLGGREHAHELVQEFMYDGELGTGQGGEGYLVTGVGVEDVAVVYVGLVGVHVVVAEDVVFAREVGVVAKA